MKIYCEAIEIVPLDVEPDFIRSDITEKTDAEKLAIQSAMEDVMSGKHYRLSTHYCYHEDGGACRSELIKEV